MRLYDKHTTMLAWTGTPEPWVVVLGISLGLLITAVICWAVDRGYLK